MPKTKPLITVENVVASASLNHPVDLDTITRLFPTAEYRSEQFPGLIHRMATPKVVILLFASGKLVVTGAKKEEDTYQAVDILHKNLEKEKIIFYD